jgi:hypothetical protein
MRRSVGRSTSCQNADAAHDQPAARLGSRRAAGGEDCLENARTIDGSLDVDKRVLSNATKWFGITHDAATRRVEQEVDHGREITNVLNGAASRPFCHSATRSSASNEDYWRSAFAIPHPRRHPVAFQAEVRKADTPHGKSRSRGRIRHRGKRFRTGRSRSASARP